ncbi:hypothetical protein VitviT2T_016056 [Vitis vinifera]|uniref:J domain-containing protein n=1 Tax=Vitis vinifera TaxID=29760 RepID=A0ABY9CQT7_VITVI|nr:hypothetical protein VitviT2T_016056 [Vitis vinifera]
MWALEERNPKDYYKVLKINYDATDEKIKLNYRRLALVSDLSFF